MGYDYGMDTEDSGGVFGCGGSLCYRVVLYGQVYKY